MDIPEKDDGGPAFPIPAVFSPECGTMPGHHGMTLRRWYAGMALTMITDKSTHYTNWDCKEIAKKCFEMADAMLRQGSK